MTNKIKRALSVLLSVLMLLSVVPITAFAADTVSLSGIFCYEGTSTPVEGQPVALRDGDMNLLATAVTDASGSFTFAVAKSSSYYITVEDGPAYAFDDEYAEDNAYFAVTTTNETNTFFKGGSTKYLKPSVGTINFVKYIDGTTQTIPGAVYELLDETDAVIDTKTTGSSGEFSITNVPYGTYKLQEKVAPDGYYKNDEAKEVRISKNGDVVNVSDSDVAICGITLIKTDSVTSSPLPNAVFKLQEMVDGVYTEVGTYTTDAEGKIETGPLMPGTFKFVETSAPEGYIVEQAEYDVELTSTQPRATIYAVNLPCPKITITKLDSEADTFVPGAVMKIVNADTNEDVMVFDTLDTVAQVYLVPGNYKLVEVAAPDGYIKGDDVPFTVTLGNNDTITMYEDARSLIINKFGEDENGTTTRTVDGVTKKYSPLSGVSYSIQPQDGTGETIVVDNANSTHTVSRIKAGEYKIFETAHPDYYVDENPEGLNITVTENGKFTIVNIYNDYVKYPITFKKVNTDNELIAADFNISGSFNTNVDFSANEYTIALRPGTYTLSEVNAPAGYTTIEDATIVVGLDGSVTYNGDVLSGATVTIIDKPITCKIHKVDSETHEVIAGARMKIEKADGSYVKEFVTTSEPMVISKELTPGDYTLTELSAPYGYGVAAPVNFTILNTDTIQNVFMSDLRLTGKVIIDKKGDSFDNVSRREIIAGYVENFFSLVGGVLGLPSRPIADVEFTVYADEDIVHPDGHTGVIYAKDTVVAVVSTDASGYAKVENLPFGKYRVAETGTPSGYIVDSTPKYFTIDEDHGLVKAESVSVYNTTKTLTVTVNKKDNYGNKVDDALFAIYNAEDINSSSGTCVLPKDSLITVLKTVDGTATTQLNVPLGKYYLKEESVPDGYIKDSTVYNIDFIEDNPAFSATASNMSFSYDIVNTAITIDISKLDKISGEQMADVKLQLLDSSENVYEEWTSDGTPHVIKAIPAGQYTIREVPTQSIPGYKIADDVLITVEPIKETQHFAIENERQVGSIKIVKTVKNSTEPLSGVTFNVYDETNKVNIGNFTTDSTGIIEIADLPVAKYENGKAVENITYTVSEVSAPAGYILADSQSVEFNDLDTSKSNWHQFDKEINFENDYTKVAISKYIKGTTELLAGVSYALYSEENYNPDLTLKDDAVPYAEWETSDSESFVIEKIPAGKYLLVEKTAPDGYVIADYKEIVIENTAALQFFSVENAYTHVSIAKVDVATNDRLPNAQLALFKESDCDESGYPLDTATAVCTWETKSEEDFFVEKFPAGNYYLVELSAPSGYVKAEPVLISIASVEDLQEFTLLNDFTKVAISKLDKNTNEPLQGAKLALYSSDNTETPLYTWESAAEPFRIDRLPAGEYTIVETEAPEGYLLAAPSQITVKDTAQLQSFEFLNDYTKVEILKIDDKTEKPVKGAHLSLYKAEDVDDAGVPIENATPVESWVSDNSAHHLDKLPAGQYVLIETEAPEGYVLGKAATITVEDTADVQLFKYSNVEKPLEEIVPEKPDIPDTGAEVASCVLLFVLVVLALAFIERKSIYRIIRRK